MSDRVGAMDELAVTVAGCLACEMKPAVTRGLCRACHMAVYRRSKRGEPWADALADRRRQIQRAARGWTSGSGRKQATGE